MKSRVRYICVPVTSFELADALPEHEKAVFVEQVLQMFKMCEAGNDPVPERTENRVLYIALEDAAREIKKGYDSYIQKITARSGKTETGSTSAIDQRPMSEESTVTREEKRIDLIEKDIKESSEETGQRGQPFSQIELQSINYELSCSGISPDNAFYTSAKKAGYRITIDSIRQARDKRSKSIAYVVKLMQEALKDAV